MSPADLEGFVRSVPDYPKPGVLFRDLSPLLANPVALRAAGETLAAPFRGSAVSMVAGIEARGFVFATLVARELGAGFLPLRKRGKLPGAVVSAAYELEYGTAVLEAQCGGLRPGERVLVVDDVLATGGTLAAGVDLIEQLGGFVVGVAVLLELVALGGRGRLAQAPVHGVLSA